MSRGFVMPDFFQLVVEGKLRQLFDKSITVRIHEQKRAASPHMAVI